MDHTQAEYAAILEHAFTKPVLLGLLRAIVDGYAATPRTVKKAMDAPDRHDAFGMIRRGKINEQLRGIAAHNKLRHMDEPNSKGSTYFLSIFSGDIRLVACLVGRRHHMVRPAKIRALWAKHNRNGELIELFPEEHPEPPPGAKYLAFLVHGASGRRRDLPYFVDIVIPDKEFKTYMCRVKLLSLFPQVAEDLAKAYVPVRKEPTARKTRKANVS